LSLVVLAVVGRAEKTLLQQPSLFTPNRPPAGDSSTANNSSD